MLTEHLVYDKLEWIHMPFVFTLLKFIIVIFLNGIELVRNLTAFKNTA